MPPRPKTARVLVQAPAVHRTSTIAPEVDREPECGHDVRFASAGNDPRSTEELMRLHVEARSAVPCDARLVEELRNLLIERYLPLVHAVAQRLVRTLPRSVEFEDLVGAGVFGLMDAIRCFDPDRDVRFKTYATTRLRGSILDSLRSGDWVPRLVRTEAARVGKAIAALGGEFGREPTQMELSEALDIDMSSLASHSDRYRPPSVSSFAAPRNSDPETAVVMEVADTHADPASADLRTREAFANACVTLTARERFILEQYYRRGSTMREIGEMLQLTESRICQVHTNVVARLRETLVARHELGGE